MHGHAHVYTQFAEMSARLGMNADEPETDGTFEGTFDGTFDKA